MGKCKPANHTIITLRCLKRHNVKISSRHSEAFSGFDTFCQYLKFDFYAGRFISPLVDSEQSELILNSKAIQNNQPL
jgi:hypothetical protein